MRLFILLFAAFVSVTTSFSQTTSCNTATVLTAVNTASCAPGTTFNLSGTGTGPTMSSCNTNGTATNNWGQFVANGTTATISYQPASNRDAMIYAYSGTCPSGLTQIGCVDAFGIGGREDLTLTGLTANATYYVRIVRYGSTGNMVGNICIASTSSNTITTGGITGSPFCAGASLSVPFTSSGTFTSNTYTAQLSDAAGSFSSPVSIGTLVSNSNSGTITATLPAGTATGTGYRIRVISSSPSILGADNGTGITINDLPSLPTAGNNSRCGTGNITITATPGAGETIDWYAAATGGTALVTGNTSYTTSLSSTTSFYAQARNTTTGCLASTRTTVTATVYTTIPSSPSAGSNSRCGTGTVTITATPGAGETIDWYAASSGGTALVTGNTSYTTPSISSSTTYYAQARNTTTGCLSSARTAVIATVNAAPADKTVSATSSTTCSGTSTSIQVAFSEVGVNYQLRNNSGNVNIGSTVSGNLFGITLNTGNLTTTTTFNVLATNTTSGCSVQMTNTPAVTVYNPTATAGPNLSACQSLTPGAITLTGASVSGGATTGAWSIVSGTGTLSSTSQTSSPATVTFLPDDNYTGTVTLRLTTNTPGGCTAGTSTRNIVVNPKPVATITANHCVGGGVVRLSVNSFASYLWNTTGQTTQTIDVITAGNFTVTVTDVNGCVATDTYTTGTELVTNGDFNAGNTGFTTAYVYTPNIAGNTELYPEGYYAVGNNANDYHNAFNGTDHTSGSGNFMIVNGTVTADQIVWSQNGIAVTPNTTYYFSAWGLTLVSGNNAILRFSINGTQVGSSATLPNGYSSPSGPFAWTRFFGSWNSGSATVANLSIVNLQLAAGGNDFGMDDISFSNLPPLTLSTAPSSSTGNTICTNSTINLLSNVSGGNYPLTYAWTGPNSFTSTLQNPVITNAVAANAGTYSVTVTDKYGCSVSGSSSTITILPVIANNTVSAAQSICTNTTPAALTGSTPTGGDGTYTYLWESSTTSASAGFATASGTSNTAGYSPGILYQNTWYRRTVNSGTCSDISAAIQITVSPIISGNSFTSAQTICSGSTPAAFTGSTPTGGNGTYTYLWESSTTSASAGFATATGTANGINYSPAALTQNTWFRRTVTSGGCSSVSTVLLITVNPVIGNHTVSAAQSICSGSTPASLTNSTPTGGSGTYSYVWESSTTSAVAGFAAASGSNLFQNYNPPALTQTTWYRTTITSGGCTSVATPIAITVTPAIAGNTITPSQTICTSTAPATLAGATPTGGSGTYTYLWERSTTSATSGFAAAPGTNNAQDYSPPVLTQTTWYRRTVTSGSCSSVSATVQVTITPVINTNTITAAQTICSGSTPAALSGSTPTGGSGSGTYTYLWESSTTSAAAGFSTATGTSNTIGYTPAALTQTTWFRRTVTSGGCSSTSATVQITVTPSIANNTISADQSICTNTTPAALTGATATGGTGSYTYLWQSSTTSAVAGFGTAGGTSNGVNYTPGTLFQTTWYRRTVTSGICSDVSAVVQITVSPIIGNNSFTSAQTICSGSTPAAFTGSTPTGGNGTYTYLWESSTTSAAAGFGTAAGTANTINYSPAALTQNTWFRRTVTSGGCSSTSTVLLITVNPVIGNHMVSAAQSICSGSTPAGLTNSTPTGGSGTYSYVWESSTTSAVAGFAAASGSNLFQNYNPPALTQTTWYRTTITSGGCTSVATPIAITVTPAIAGNTITASQTICTGTAPATLAGATPTGGSGSYTYLWESSTTSATFGFATATGTSNNINYSPATLTQTTWYRRTVTSGSCSSVSATVQITITPVINTNTITAAQTICSGSTPAALSGSTPTGGSGTYTYLWESSTTSAAAGFSTATGTSNTIGYTPAALTQTTWFRRTVTSGGCSSTSATVQITVTPSIANNIISADQSICTSTTPAALTGATATGGTGTYTYLWQSSTTSAVAGFGTAGGTSNGVNYTPGVLTQTTWYRRTVTSGICSDISAVIQITVSPVLAGNSFTAAQTICTGSTPAAFTGSTPTGGNGTYTYLWESSTTSAAAGFATATGTSNNIDYSPGALTQTTWYRRSVTSGGCSSTSAAVQITVTPVIANNTITTSQSICSGSAPSTLTGSVPTGGTGTYTYTWQSSTTSAVAGFSTASGTSNAISYTSGNLTQTTWFRRLVNSGTCSDYSAVVQVTTSPGGQWMGSVNNDWNVAGNWCGGIPTSSTNVTIPAGSAINIQSANAVANSVTISSGGSLVMTGAYNLTITAGGSFTNNGTFTASASTGSVVFNGNGTISGTTSFQNIDTKGALDFGTSSTVNGVFTLQMGGSVTGNAPVYACPSSTLQYNTGTVFTRGLEWSTTPSGTGYPANVIVQNNTTINFPVTGQGYVCNDLTIQSGGALLQNHSGGSASLSVGRNVIINGTLALGASTGGDINVGGSWTRNSGGTFTSNDRKVTFDGPTNFSGRGTSFATITAPASALKDNEGGFGGEKFAHIWINKTNAADSVVLLSNITVTRELGLTKGTFSLRNSDVTLVSNASRTADVAPISTAANVAVRYAGTGRFNIQRFVQNPTAVRSWRLLTAPVQASGAPTINEAWQYSTVNPDKTQPNADGGIYNPWPGYGMHITGAGGNYDLANGFDHGTNAASALYATPGIAGWAGVSSTTGTKVTDEPGWMLFVRGDRGFVIGNQYTPSQNTTLETRGMINTGDVKKAIPAGKQVIGNPYPSAISLKDVDISGTPGRNSNYSRWDPKMFTSYTQPGKWVSFTGLGSSFISTTSASAYDANGTIESGEAIVIEPTSAGNITFHETDKLALTSSLVGIANRPAYTYSLLRSDMYAGSGGNYSLTDAVVNLFEEDFTNPVSGEDVKKVITFNTKESFTLDRDNIKLAIEKRKPVDVADTIFYGISKFNMLPYQIRFTPSGFNSSVTAFLEDTYLHTTTPVSLQSASNVDFEITADPASASSSRFRMVLKQAAVLPVTFTDVKAWTDKTANTIEWQVQNELNIKQYEMERSANGIDFSKLATIPAKGNYSGSQTYSQQDIAPVQGDNFYRIRSISNNGSGQLSKVVKASAAAVAGSIKLYSNPVTDGIARLHIANAAAGSYSFRLLNPAGQTILVKGVKHTAGDLLVKMDVNRKLPAGNYTIEVVQPGSIKTIHVVFQ